MSEHNMYLESVEFRKPVTIVAQPGVNLCQIHTGAHAHGSAQPLILHGHHPFPKFLQLRVYGEVLHDDTNPVCPNGHDALHYMLDRLLRGADVSMYAHMYSQELLWARRGLALYNEALALKSDARATGPRAIDPDVWRCPRCGGGMVGSPVGGKQRYSHNCPS